MKKGDIIHRRDVPQFKFIVGDDVEGWKDMVYVEPVEKYRGFGRWKGRKSMIDKNDERWVVE